MIAALRVGAVLVAVLGLPSVAPALADAPLNAPESVTVIGSTMLPGTGVAADRLPESLDTLDEAQLRPGVTSTLEGRLGAVSINDNLDDPFQPDILYRGFEASPVLGTPEGLAVFQNGVRINEPFGDAVNWDLVPDAAVRRVDVVSANPVYGLNALGGAVVVSMKNGFDDPGASMGLSGGSWARHGVSAQTGHSDGQWAYYGAAQYDAEDGWRAFSPDAVLRGYGALSFRGETVSVDLTLTLANNTLDGESPAPVQELEVDRALVFTNPQSTRNRLIFPALDFAIAPTAALNVTGAIYYRGFWLTAVNGNTTGYETCATLAGRLCQPDGVTPLSDLQGNPVPDLSQGGRIAIGEIDSDSIASSGTGGTLAVTDAAQAFGRDNHFVMGASIDAAATQFGSAAEIGVVATTLRVGASGYFVDTPEGTGVTATPVSLAARTRNVGAFAADTFSLTTRLSLTASGRFNDADIALADRRGQALDGHAHYDRFNPGAGLTYAFDDSATAWIGYAGGNRTPTPDELECADPAAPCVLPSSLSSDPPLKQVVSHSVEAGLRGHVGFSADGAPLFWRADVYRTDVDDDIYGVATSLSSGFFRNIGSTRRQGIDLDLHYDGPLWSGYVSYDYVAATFESAFLLPSPDNAGTDVNGNISVRPGDTLPGIPRQRLKLGVDYRLAARWRAGFGVVLAGSQFFRGDEANDMKPLAGFATLNLHGSVQVTTGAQLTLQVANVLDARYATFGELGDPRGVGAPGVPDGGGTDFRFESPAAPRTILAGLELAL